MSFQDFLKLVGAILAAIGGGGALVLALSSWLGKIWAERILNQDRHRYNVEIEKVKSDYRHLVDSTLERLKDELGRGQFVHHLQFETEFKIYLDLWDKVERGRMGMIGFLTGEPGDKEMRLGLLSDAEKDLRQFVFHYRPFIPRSVYDKASDVMLTALGLTNDPGQTVVKLEVKDVHRICDTLCDAIHERIGIIGSPGPGHVPDNIYVKALKEIKQPLDDIGNRLGTTSDVS
jgi:hypothetical protein